MSKKLEWEKLADKGLKVSAVKSYRALHFCSLKEAYISVCEYMGEPTEMKRS